MADFEQDIYEYLVKDSDAGQRIDKLLSIQLTDFSRSYIQKLLSNRAVLIHGQPIKSNYKVKEGDYIQVEIPEPEVLDVQPENIPLDIVYEDTDILIINKPKGMVVHPAAGHYSGTLVNAILYHCQDDLSTINGVLRPGIVHRIDMDTTGLLVICKNNMAHQSLAEQLKVHSITRKYTAIVYDNIPEDNGTIHKTIGRHPVDRKKQAVNVRNGRDAITHYRVLERFGGKYTMVECQLETGRTHQIRVHMASIHHPLLGDTVYGPSKDPFHLQGQTLHAGVLGFIHPRTGKYVEFHSELPEYFQNLILMLRNS
ncbi:pseudouridine synthase [Clostridium sp. CAG:632]|jgi:23S rRNA pseudouridine1911/1915/1917 synthase|nr:RluA family pseudouridine synthase [Clostridium sp.]MDD6266877.1 RluA family pseudouridine synthase [Clostridium sp.]CCY58756.1 pseudouridine synthase [Clostridium sp. CAG:632]